MHIVGRHPPEGYRPLNHSKLIEGKNEGGLVLSIVESLPIECRLSDDRW